MQSQVLLHWTVQGFSECDPSIFLQCSRNLAELSFQRFSFSTEAIIKKNELPFAVLAIQT